MNQLTSKGLKTLIAKVRANYSGHLGNTQNTLGK